MAYDSDYLVDRRRLKRRLVFWRTLAVIAVVAAVAAAYGRFGGALVGGDVIARVEIEGVILQDDERIEAIERLAGNEAVRAVILRIDSPGGTVAGGETLHKAILELGRAKPVIAVMDGIATSAAYMVAIAAERIYARETTLTGSIGVIVQTTEITRLLDMVGITPRAFRSGELKAVPNPLEPMTEDAAAQMQRLIEEVYGMFRDMVLERRSLSAGDAEVFADGRVFTGRQAVAARLVDEIGDEQAAIRWLERERNIPEGLEIRELQPGRDVGSLIVRLRTLARKTILSERLTLDGLVSVWHPALR